MQPMSKTEATARMKAAAKLIDTSDLPARDSFADYWAGSASQSYIDAVKHGDVRQATVRGK